MKNLLLACALTLLTGLTGWAQDGSSYRIDNFDFENGVRIQLPPTPAARGRKSWRQQKLNASDTPADTLSHSRASLPRPPVPVRGSLDGFTTGSSAVDTLIMESGTRNSVDPLLLYAIMHQESTFKPRAVSPKGARGLMQLMPATARRFGVSSIFEPGQNIEGGARYMRFLLDQFEGDIDLALAGYNAGEGAVIKYGYRVPPYRETQEYVRRIGRRYSLMRDPMAARSANTLTRDQLVAMQRKEALPLNVYERSVFAVRLPDGRLQLTSQ